MSAPTQTETMRIILYPAALRGVWHTVGTQPMLVGLNYSLLLSISASSLNLAEPPFLYL